MATDTAAPTTTASGKVLFGRYELGRLLGRGGSAKVYHAHDLHTGESIALKVFSKAAKLPTSASSATTTAAREISLMRRLRHCHVLRLLEVLASRAKIYLVLELARGGELFSKLESRGRLAEDPARMCFRQLISAVRYCHSRGVYHRDLKPENLLLDEYGDLKIADFGLGALACRTPSDGLCHTVCGTPAYVAPEILSKKGYDPAKVDVWSCGVILFVLAAGYLPFNHPNLITMYKRIYRGEFRFPRWFSPELRMLISRMLDPNPETRITVDGIMKDRWFLNGMDGEEWTAEMRSHEVEEESLKFEWREDIQKRALNAFDIISFSTGCDLSRLFDPVEPVRERFFVAEPAESVLSRAEEVARREGMVVRRENEKKLGGVLIEGQNGNLVARVDVYSAWEGLSMAEVGKGDGAHTKRFWRDKLRPVLTPPTV